MNVEVERLRATIFERTGIAIEPDDPLVAVLVASTFQAEEVGQQMLRRTSAARAVLLSAAAGLVFAGAGAWASWEVAAREARAERAEWLRQQADPNMATLLRSDQGRAGLHLAALGVAVVLARCDGRSSWRVAADYCIPTTVDGKPDGFRFRESSESTRSKHAR